MLHMQHTTTPITIRLSDALLLEISCIMEDAASAAEAGDTRDPLLVRLAPVADAIDRGRNVRGGVIVTLTPEDARSLREEVDYRDGLVRERIADAWDASERGSLLGLIRSAQTTIRKLDAALAAA
jgi:hypothetical protein